MRDDMNVKDLYEALGILIDNDFGDLEVRVSFDTNYATTSIKKKIPSIKLSSMREYSYVLLEGY